QRPDEMQFEAWPSLPQRGPLGRRLLNAVLPEDPLAGVQRGRDSSGWLRLADGNESHSSRIAAGTTSSTGDAVADCRQVRGHVTGLGGEDGRWIRLGHGCKLLDRPLRGKTGPMKRVQPPAWSRPPRS